MSIVFHAIVLLILWRLKFSVSGPQRVEVEIMARLEKRVDAEYEFEKDRDIKRETKLQEIETSKVDVPKIETDVTEFEEDLDTDNDMALSEMADGSDDKMGLMGAEFIGVLGGAGNASGTGGYFGGRTNMQSRRSAVRKNRAPPGVIKAVEDALAYLARIQNPDGSWGSKRHAGATGVCLLAYMGAGYTQKTGKYKKTVAGAIKYLLSTQKPDGKFVTPGSNAYDSGVASFAIAECYAFTNDRRLREPVQRMVDMLVKGQIKVKGPMFGSWGYSLSGKADSTTSITNWQVQALVSARMGKGIKIPRETYKDILTFYAANFVADGRTLYRKGSGYDNQPMSGSVAGSVYGKMLLKVPKHDPTIMKGIEWITEHVPSGWGTNWGNPSGDEYYWYYATLAMFYKGGKSWLFWNKQIAPFLLKRQNKDGSWLKTGYGGYVGDANGAGGKRSWSTALPALILEVYYRYSPE